MATLAKPDRKKKPSSLGEGARACAMKLRVYPTLGQEKRLAQWLYCAKRFRNEAVAFCNTRRLARGAWVWQHPALSRDWKPEELQDAGLYRFKQLISHECHKQGKLLLQCGRFDASTQICSVCDYKHTKLKNNLKIRSWVCPACNTFHDRDHNAATNILLMALSRAMEHQEISTGPENGLGVSTSHRVHLHADLSAFIARGGLTAILDHTRSLVRRRAGLSPRPGPEGADEARVLPRQPHGIRRERVGCD